MCGILGLIRKVDSAVLTEEAINKLRNIFNDIMLDSETRGFDSSGVLLVNAAHYAKTSYNYVHGVNNTSTVPEDCARMYMYKAPLKASSFIQTEKYKQILSKIEDNTIGIIGHTRQATSGSCTNNINNHPHRCGNIIGVHNGIINNWRILANTMNINLNSKCDSEIIFALIDHFKRKENKTTINAIKETCKLIIGWYSCIVMDTENPNKFYIFRHRAPLNIRFKAYAPQLLIMASEENVIKKVYKKHLTTATYGPGPTFIDMSEIELLEDTGMVFDIDTTGHDDWAKKPETFSLSV
jgi:glucosamine 6-phosphate synthetase-like amidotransferase/phosphosugar isomerase protein